MGRGSGGTDHEGNQGFRNYVDGYSRRYFRTCDHHKVRTRAGDASD